MAKARSRYVCRECGADSRQYFGKCPFCGSWNSMVEEIVPESSTKASGKSSTVGEARASLMRSHLTKGSTTKGSTTTNSTDSAATSPPRPLASRTLPQITDHSFTRLSSGYGELDRVLGGGIVPGSLVLIGGDPGIGKSTLLLQVANQLGRSHPVLYVCAEESGQQVKLRAQRLGVGQSTGPASRQPTKQSGTPAPASSPKQQEFYVLPETDLEAILTELGALRPQVAIIDSIQALYFSALNSAPGSVSQVRECTSALMHVAKRDNITLLIVGHVTKEGAIAGPKVLEHLVDTVLYFEGDRFASHRLLRSVKNRFGATQELGIFEMADQGLTEVLNPSELFMGNRDEQVSGIATIVACEGTRPLLVELQALVSPTSYASPRRSTTGIEYNRLLQILAVLEKRVGIPLSKLDAYVASSGGLAVGEPAADLGVAVAVAASFRDRVVDPGTVLIGEVGLGGQVRTVSQMERRLKEAAKLGFTRAIIPATAPIPDIAMDIIQVKRVVDAIGAAFTGAT
ncbi:MAG: DNA repair protein RadA [Merismopedia sp. SIO2A8]|nr:DNA repair protein RadA [Merismopedia sp. SIO2A8]